MTPETLAQLKPLLEKEGLTAGMRIKTGEVEREIPIKVGLKYFTGRMYSPLEELGFSYDERVLAPDPPQRPQPLRFPPEDRQRQPAVQAPQRGGSLQEPRLSSPRSSSRRENPETSRPGWSSAASSWPSTARCIRRRLRLPRRRTRCSRRPWGSSRASSTRSSDKDKEAAAGRSERPGRPQDGRFLQDLRPELLDGGRPRLRLPGMPGQDLGQYRGRLLHRADEEGQRRGPGQRLRPVRLRNAPRGREAPRRDPLALPQRPGQGGPDGRRRPQQGQAQGPRRGLPAARDPGRALRSNSRSRRS
ncbi:MAG: hypothetical protein MZV70_01290 [Desulfobacterales bacterium]|nr:hypothetical protein [Desulfobacterales bacterium]